MFCWISHKSSVDELLGKFKIYFTLKMELISISISY